MGEFHTLKAFHDYQIHEKKKNCHPNVQRT